MINHINRIHRIRGSRPGFFVVSGTWSKHMLRRRHPRLKLGVFMATIAYVTILGMKSSPPGSIIYSYEKRIDHGLKTARILI